MATLKALTSKEMAKLNKSMRAAKEGAPGSESVMLGFRMGASASYVVTAADASASSITIQTSLPNVSAAIVQVYRSGSPMYAVKENVSGSNLVITTSASGTWKIAASDVVVYHALP